MSINFPFTMTDKGISMFVNNKHCMFAKDHPNHDAIRTAIEVGDEETAMELADMRTTVSNHSSGRVEILDNTIVVDGREVVGLLVDRILEMVSRGSDAIDGYVRFLDNLMGNPSKRAVDELYGFVEACNLPITPDGHLLAYRFVGSDYMDGFSGSVLNMPADLMDGDTIAAYSQGVIGGRRNEVTIQVVDGQTVISCPRNMVNEDKNQTCSEGLHFCSYDYLPSYGVNNGRRVVVVKINPADVVAIPIDYNNAKGRTAKYTVVAEIEDWSFTRLTPYYTAEYEYGYDLNNWDDDLDFLDDDLDDLDDEDEDDTRYDLVDNDGVIVADKFAGLTTLAVEDVENIKALIRDRNDLSMSAIGRAYGVNHKTIIRIRNGETWAHVPAARRAVWPV